MSDHEHPMHFQTVLYESDMAKLKTKTKASSTKDALSIAVEHYLKCKNTKATKEDTLNKAMEV